MQPIDACKRHRDPLSPRIRDDQRTGRGHVPSLDACGDSRAVNKENVERE